MNLRIIKKTAEKEGITQELTEKIERSMFLLIKETIEEGNFKGISLPRFGKFVVKPYNKEKYKNNAKPKDRIAARKARTDKRRMDQLVIDFSGVQAGPKEDAE